MKRLTVTACLLLVLLWYTSYSFGASATYTFSNEDAIGGQSWGTLTVSVSTANSLKFSFLASDAMPDGAQVTGFGFDFDSLPIEVINPDDPAFSNDQNSLNWVESTNLNAIPQPTNRFEFSPNTSKRDYSFAVTEGKANNFTPPGIMSGELDIFYLIYDSDLFPGGTTDSDLFDFINLSGIRIQSISNNKGEGSPFLVGAPVPIPTTLMLLGSGLFGMLLIRRRAK